MARHRKGNPRRRTRHAHRRLEARIAGYKELVSKKGDTGFTKPGSLSGRK